MYLKRLTLINWANIPSQALEFAHITMMTGPTGAGKTTILDAIQTLLTAGLPDILHYNAGQGDVGRRSKEKKVRSLGSYVLGVDETLCARPNSAHAYIVGYFEPGPGEDAAEPFTAVFAASAYMEHSGSERTPRHEDPVCFLVRREELTMDDLTISRGSFRDVVPVNEIIRHLRIERPDLDRIEVAQNRNEFLAMLYAAFSGRTGVLNRDRARKAARAVVKFMVYRRMENLSVFVRDDILEPVDMSTHLKQVSQVMRQIQQLEYEAREVQEGIDLLTQANRAAAIIVEVICERALRDYEKVARTIHQGEARRQEALEDRREAEEALEAARRGADEAEEREQKLTGRYNDLQKTAAPEVHRREELDRRIGEEKQKRERAARTLQAEQHKRHSNYALLLGVRERLRQPEAWAPRDDNWLQKVSLVIDGDGWETLDIARHINEEAYAALLSHEEGAQRVQLAYNELVSRLLERRDDIEAAYHHANQKVVEANNAIRDLEDEIETLRSRQQITYPDHTRRALALIERELPGAHPRVLCDFVDVTDERWQLAIEGLFGYGRFNILVEPKWEAAAVDLINRHHRELGRAAVAQGEKARRDVERNRKAVHSASIAHLMRFSDPTVEAVVTARYGQVQQVMSTEALRMIGRGLTMDGNASGGYQMRVVKLDEADLVFGQRARERALRGKQRKLEELSSHVVGLERQRRDRLAFVQAVRDIKTLSLVEAIEEVTYPTIEIEGLEEKIRDLDMTDQQPLLDELNCLKEQIGQARKEAGKARTEVGKNETLLDTIAKQLGGIEKDLETVRGTEMQRLVVIDQMRAAWADYDWEMALERIRQALDDETNAIPGRDDRRARGRLHELVPQFNAKRIRTFRIELSHLPEEADELDDLENTASTLRQIRSVLGALSNDLLVQHMDSLKAANRQFNEVFVTDVCLTLNNALREGEDMLKTLNRQLERHGFGEEYYQFAWQLSAEYADYARFFRTVADNPPTDFNYALEEDEQYDERDRQIFQRLRALLLSENEDRAWQELRRLSDYRNYRDYDIIKRYRSGNQKDISLRRYGTGSGGQVETPSYVFRTAALASALGWHEGGPSLRFCMIDESFEKVDEQRTGDVIDYLTETMGLQFLFVIPNLKAGPIYNHVDLALSITKLPSTQLRGELMTEVHVDRTVINRERVDALWQREKYLAEQRAQEQMSFLDLVDGNATAREGTHDG